MGPAKYNYSLAPDPILSSFFLGEQIMYDLFLYYHFVPLIEKIFFSAIRKTRQGIINDKKSFYATDKKKEKIIDCRQSSTTILLKEWDTVLFFHVSQCETPKVYPPPPFKGNLQRSRMSASYASSE